MIRLEINIGSKQAPDWQDAYLDDDVSIDIEEVSQLWNKDQSTFSQEFTLPYEPNRHILGNADDVWGASIYKRLYKHQYRLWVGGIIWMQGTIDMDEEVDLDGGGVSISLTSGRKTFDEMLDGVSARDVEIYYPENPVNKEIGRTTMADFRKKHPGKTFQNVPIGYTWDGRNAKATVWVGVFWSWVGRKKLHFDGDSNEGDANLSPKKMAFNLDVPQIVLHNGSGIGAVNTSSPYMPGEERYKAPYCNIPLCSQRYVKEGDKWEKRRGYVYTKKEDDGYSVDLTQSRYNSSPCFFVLFWLETLLDVYLDVQYDISALTENNDIRSLCFINYACRFESERTEEMFDFSKASMWFDANGNHYPAPFGGGWGGGPTIASGGWRERVDDDHRVHFHYGTPYEEKPYGDNAQLKVYCGNEGGRLVINLDKKDTKKADCMATAENFPDTDAKNIIEGLENAFGCRFIYDDTDNTLKVVSYRDTLTAGVSYTVDCFITDVYKQESKLSGFRLKYGSSSKFDSNKLTGDEGVVKGSDGTTFNYNDYSRVTPLQGVVEGGGAQGRDYVAIARTGHENWNNMNFYVSAKTGNGYRWKVDSDAKTADEWNASLFEVGGFRDVEYGNCTDDDNVETVSIPFDPVIVNDVAYEQEKAFGTDADANENAPANYCVYVGDVEVHEPDHQNQIPIPLDADSVREWLSAFGFITEAGAQILPNSDWQKQVVYCYNFKLPQGIGEDDKNLNPFNSVDAGFTLGFMRSTSENSGIVTFDSGFDGIGNARWSEVTGTGGGFVTADSCSAIGGQYGISTDVTELDIKIEAKRYTKDQIAELISKNFNNSKNGIDFLDERRGNVKPSDIIGKGYRDPGYNKSNVYCFLDVWKSSYGFYFIMTPIENDGTVLDRGLSYPNGLSGGGVWGEYSKRYLYALACDRDNIMSIDSVVCVCDTMEEAKNRMTVLRELCTVYFTCDKNGSKPYGYLNTPLYEYTYNVSRNMSLKLKAEKPVADSRGLPDERPFRAVDYTTSSGKAEYDRMADVDRKVFGGVHYVLDYENGSPLYYNIDSQYANRGLFDMCWTEYAYFITHRKTAVISVADNSIELSSLRRIDKNRKCRIGQYEGWINRIAYRIEKDGVKDIKFELYYI